MKKLYFVFLLITSFVHSQDEGLLGEWVLDSIFETDVFLTEPENPISITFNTENNYISIESFCGATYQSYYTPSTTENAIEITDVNWDIVYCDEDTQGWESSMSNLLTSVNASNNIRTLSYIINNDGSNTLLELSFSYLHEGITTNTTGYFTKVNAPPQQITGQWYLYSIFSDNQNHENIFGNLTMNFLEGTNGYFIFDASSSCNYFSGDYSILNDVIEMNIGATTLVDCLGPRNGFESIYLGLFNPDNSFTYTINGSGMDQILILTKSNGDYIVYGKIESNMILNRTWYLETITTNNITYNVTPGSSAYITLNPNLTGIIQETLQFHGSGDCNQYDGTYLQGNNNITITGFNATSEICNPETDFESIYFSMLGDDLPNTFDFEIINNGNNLILTSVLDDDGRSSESTLVFSRQTLSTEHYELNNKKITLKENLVNNTILVEMSNINFSNTLKYNIYNIEGKVIKNEILYNNSVDVSTLQSGMYFIRFTDNQGLISNLKFIKN